MSKRSAGGLDAVTRFLENQFARRICAQVTLPATAGELSPLPEALDARLRAVLEADGIRALYRHQAEAFAQLSAGRDTLLVSRTASGKTLAFLLPILNAYIQASAPGTTLLLYPTKALSRDQEGTLGRLLQAALGTRQLGTFDGDTPPEERRQIQRAADFVITNPDMLHAGILPNHNRAWRSFLSRLRYIVVDEVHTYRGAFGSHVANVFRRLLRVAALHGSHPIFVCSSATVGNPAEQAQALCGRPFALIDRDGAPRPRRDLYLLNPERVQSAGAALYRKGPGSITVPLIRQAAAAGVRTICFCRARQQVERLWRAVTDGRPELRAQVQPYRGGLLPSERRRLERDLFAGRLNTIITTNALELGIDIGDLDLCLLSGHPGTVASFWQQAGRVGRKGDRAVIVFVAREEPIDQYLVAHPDFITQTPIEQAWLHADNPYILLQHLPCAAYEHPLRREEPLLAGAPYDAALDVLAAEKTLQPYHDSFRYALSDYPARGVNLRGLTDYNVEIHCGAEVIGEIDPIGARGTLYKDAIYQHLGRRYMSLELDLAKKLCQVAVVDVDYYTEAVWESRIEMTARESVTERHGAELAFGAIHVNRQPKLFKKIRERTYENIGYGPITLPAFEYDTMGFSLRPAPDWQQALAAEDLRYIGAALYGLRQILHRAAPSLCMADPADIATDVALHEEEDDQRWQSALYVYDALEGGVGYAEKICERLEEALELCRRILLECGCEAGCPACVPPLPPGVASEDLEALLTVSDAARACTLSLLANLLEGRIEVPVIRTFQQPPPSPMAPPGEDQEARRLRQRLERAAAGLAARRQREH